MGNLSRTTFLTCEKIISECSLDLEHLNLGDIIEIVVTPYVYTEVYTSGKKYRNTVGLSLDSYTFRIDKTFCTGYVDKEITGNITFTSKYIGSSCDCASDSARLPGGGCLPGKAGVITPEPY